MSTIAGSMPPVLDWRTLDAAARAAALARPANDARDSVRNDVAAVIATVRARGDAALRELTARFDGLNAGSMAELEIPHSELKAALQGLPAAQRTAREVSALNATVPDYFSNRVG